MLIALAPPTPGQFLLALVVGTASSLGVFAHANNRGNRHATAWGIAAFLGAGIVVALYFLLYWLRQRRR